MADKKEWTFSMKEFLKDIERRNNIVHVTKEEIEQIQKNKKDRKEKKD